MCYLGASDPSQTDATEPNGSVIVPLLARFAASCLLPKHVELGAAEAGDAADIPAIDRLESEMMQTTARVTRP